MNLEDNKLTKEEKLIYVLNSLEKANQDEKRKEELRKIKEKLMIQYNLSIKEDIEILF